MSQGEASLLETFRQLSPETAAEPSALTQRLAALAMTCTVDWSDSWSDDDLTTYTAASVKGLKEEDAR